MIIIETIIINNKEFQHTYSDIGFHIERDGIQYEDAIDSINSGRIYTETNIKIEKTEEAQDDIKN